MPGAAPAGDLSSRYGGISWRHDSPPLLRCASDSIRVEDLGVDLSPWSPDRGGDKEERV
jgi:hypothetical protein